MSAKKESRYLFNVKQRKGEAPKSYTQIFNKAKINIAGFNESVAVEAYNRNDSLTMRTPSTMIEVLERTNEYIKWEKDKWEDRKEKGSEAKKDALTIEFTNSLSRERQRQTFDY